MRVELPIFWPRTWSEVVDLLYRNSTRVKKDKKKIGIHSCMMVPRDALSMGMLMMALQNEAYLDLSLIHI